MSFLKSILSKASSIWVLIIEETVFITEVKLATSFPRALAKRFIDQGGYWNVAVFRGGKGFSASNISI